jgi:hypothetical protein
MLGPNGTSKSGAVLEAQRQLASRAGAKKRGGKSPLLVATGAGRPGDNQTMLTG